MGLAGVVFTVGAVGARAGLFGSAPPISYYLGTFLITTIGGLVLFDTLAVFIKFTLIASIPVKKLYITTIKQLVEIVIITVFSVIPNNIKNIGTQAMVGIDVKNEIYGLKVILKLLLRTNIILKINPKKTPTI